MKSEEKRKIYQTAMKKVAYTFSLIEHYGFDCEWNVDTFPAKECASGYRNPFQESAFTRKNYSFIVAQTNDSPAIYHNPSIKAV